MPGRASTLGILAVFAVLLPACSSLHERSSAEDSARLRREINIETWDAGGERSRYAYLNIPHVFPVAAVRRAGPILRLPSDPNPAIGRFVVDKQGDRDVTVDELVAEGRFDGILIVHRGRIAYERYPRMRPDDKHLMFSVTKALVGTAVAILEDRGQLSVERPVSDYLAELQGTAWEKVSVRDALEMASGVDGGEGEGALSDPHHKHYQLEASLGWQTMSSELPEAVRVGDTYAFLSTLPRIRAPGSRWEYASVNTAVLGWLLERRTGRPLAEVLSNEIWSRMGAEADALMVMNRNGVAVAHAGMAATLRDLARFGMLFTDSPGVEGAERVISDRVLRRITSGGRPQLFEADSPPPWLSHVAYQWDAITDKGDFFKGGFGGQLLYVAPRKGVVIAYFGTNRAPIEEPYLMPLRQMVDELF